MFGEKSCHVERILDGKFNEAMRNVTRWPKFLKSGKRNTKKTVFLGIIPKQGGGVGIPKLYVKFLWPFVLAIKFTILFLNLAKIQIFIPKSAYEGSSGLRIITKKTDYFLLLP